MGSEPEQDAVTAALAAQPEEVSLCFPVTGEAEVSVLARKYEPHNYLVLGSEAEKNFSDEEGDNSSGSASDGDDNADVADHGYRRVTHGRNIQVSASSHSHYTNGHHDTRATAIHNPRFRSRR